MISAKIIADSLNPQGNRLTTFVLTFPRIVLAELNTHRMFSRNSASSRAIPFDKMVKSVEDNPFIPIAFQKDHKGMQGSEYVTEKDGYALESINEAWIEARDEAVKSAKRLHNAGVTKQLCNRLLEPFMWHTVILTSSEEGLENFFKQRNPVYESIKDQKFRSRKDAIKYYPDWNNATEIDWLMANTGQAEIHISMLAEYMWDAYNESTPRQLECGDWHIPFCEDIDLREYVGSIIPADEYEHEILGTDGDCISTDYMIKIATARCARISYTVVGEDKQHSYEDDFKLHDKLLDMYHMSPFEHCARAMSTEEYARFIKGSVYAVVEDDFPQPYHGHCNNLRGFIPYRYMIENKYV